MRILGFQKYWQKLKQPQFTTFRYPRGDKPFEVNEQVQIIIQPRKKGGGDKLGIAEISSIEWRELDKEYHQLARGHTAPMITDVEAQEDGFTNLENMIEWMEKTYGRLDWMPCMLKITLKWIERLNNATK